MFQAVYAIFRKAASQVDKPDNVMKKQLTLSIPEPCHQDWQQMTPAEKGRFCGACQKTVVDFTTMSDGELIQFFGKQQTGVCGRFQPHQLDRPVIKPKTPWPYVRYFFQALLPAFLLSLKSTAQERTLGRVAVCKPIRQGETVAVKTTPASKPISTGKVTDENGIGIPYASLLIENSKKRIYCNSVGNFQITDGEFFQKPIVVAAVGYELKELRLDKTKNNPISLIALSMELSGEVDVVGYVISKQDKSVSLISSAGKAETYFTIFPNPARPGATITIGWMAVAEGDYLMQLRPVAGQTIWTGQTRVAVKNKTFKFELPQTASGAYFLSAVNKKTGKAYSEKITIQ